MYSTCIFCHGKLGANESVEHFPIGRRLAFDGARGRLWVVCRKCERWNLSPLEERWEAIEECERLFRGTRLRVSTDNIGLARLRDGLELVRIGAPQRPEMAAWRYGDQFGRRRLKHVAFGTAGAASVAGLIILGPVTGIIAGGSFAGWNLLTSANSLYQQQRVRARLVMPGHAEPIAIRLEQLNRVTLETHGDGWAIGVPFRERPRGAMRTGRLFSGVERTALFTGDDALAAASRLLPAINSAGAGRRQVDEAVRLIEEMPDTQRLFAAYAARGGEQARRPWHQKGWTARPAGALTALPRGARLALEMATHEDSERRALEGELSLLESAWQDAEEIAAIADDIFTSDDTRDRIDRLKRGPGEP